MTTKGVDSSISRTAWDELRRRFRTVDWDPPVQPDQVDRLLNGLDKRRDGEPVTAWLRRTLRPAADACSAIIVPFKLRRSTQFRLVGEAIALAADAADQKTTELPDFPLETDNGTFRFQFAQESSGTILVTVEALGFELARLAGGQVVVTGPGGADEALALVQLDENGEGQFRVADSETMRRLLLHLQVGEIEES